MNSISSYNSYEFEFRHRPAKTLRNLTFICRAIWGNTEDTIILGAEPFDIRIPLFNRLAGTNNLIYHTSWPFWCADRVPKKPILSFQRQLWENFINNVTVVAVTERAKKSIVNLGGSAVHIPHAVDTSIYSPEQKETIDENFRILFVGRFEENKGIRDLLSAVERIQHNNITVEFAGQGPLARVIDSFDGSPTVKNLGYIESDEELARKYAEADIHVLPSYQEGVWEELFGIVIIEAMSCGTPTIATDCIGPKEIINEDIGVIVEQRNVDKLSSAINHLLSNDVLRNEMGRQSRKVAERRYDVKRVAEQWRCVLEP